MDEVKTETDKNEIAQLRADIEKLRFALGTLATWLQRDLGDAGVKQLLEMIK